MATVKISGGSRLEDQLKDLAAKLGRGGTVRVGFLEGARYTDGTPVAMIAAIQDFGAPRAGIPPRPFFRNMVAKHSPDWPAAVEQLIRTNNFDVSKTLAQMGEGIAGQLRQSIYDTNEPPLKPATIARKGFDKPLIDSGVLIGSIDFEIEF